jgi:hypothetical protein
MWNVNMRCLAMSIMLFSRADVFTRLMMGTIASRRHHSIVLS